MADQPLTDSSDLTTQVEEVLKKTRVIPLHTHNGIDSLIVTGTSINTGTNTPIIGGAQLAGGGGVTLSQSGQVITINGKFGGTGADGALSVSGTTTIDFAGAMYLEKNYTSVSITSVLQFSNPAPQGSVFKMRVQGNVSLVSGTIDLRQMGGYGGAVSGAGTGGSSVQIASIGGIGWFNMGGGIGGVVGNIGREISFPPSTNSLGGVGGAGGGAMGTSGGIGGLFGASPSYYGSGKSPYPGNAGPALSQYPMFAYPGGGGESGFSGLGPSGFIGGAGGAGGRGGGALIIECAGAYNFDSNSLIESSGAVGSDGVTTNNNGGGGGGGGGGGSILIIYGSLIADAGTYTVTGGVGGAGAAGGSGAGTSGGAGAGGMTLRTLNNYYF